MAVEEDVSMGMRVGGARAGYVQDIEGLCGEFPVAVCLSKVSRIADRCGPSRPYSISRPFQRYSLLILGINAIKGSRNLV